MRTPWLVGIIGVLAGAACRCVHEQRPIDSAVEGPREVIVSTNPAFIGCPAALLDTRRGGTERGSYIAPSDAEREALRDAAARLIGANEGGRDAARAAAAVAGFEVVDVPEIAGAALLRERPARRRGGGAYLFRLGARPGVVVQAPHTFFDQGTLPLACELFGRADAAALFINTAHRYNAADADSTDEHPADVAHASRSLFQSATEGVLRAAPQTTLVQLHGFAPRESNAMVVISSGQRSNDDPLVGRAAAALSTVVSPGVLRFPSDTSELGATTNVQGSAARAAGGRFLHVEMAEALRTDLLRDDRLRGRFLDALSQSLLAR
jgi:hypothetical protein